MKRHALPNIPAVPDLETAYVKLLDQNLASAEELGVYSQWSRYDPRLAELWVSFLARKWEILNPIELRNALLKQRWPAASAVLLEFTEKLVSATTREPNSRHLFQLWSRIVTDRLPKGNGEQFFIGLRQFAGKAMWEDARFSFLEYRRWGYLGREILLNKGGNRSQPGKASAVGTHSLLPSTRQEILESLLSTSPRITTELYWIALNRCISRRQAERDLRNNRSLRARGKTKARYFTRRSR